MDKLYPITILIPTFKEGKTIKNTIITLEEMIVSSGINAAILIVDDASPDATISEVESLIPSYSNLSFLIREEDPGLSQAIIDGCKNSRSKIIVVTDADGSHDCSIIPEMCKAIDLGADIAIGSRYIPGGGISGWPPIRQVISLGATYLARLIIPQLRDPVSGFFACKRNIVLSAPLHPRGYKILFEILGKGTWKRVVEIPYTFKNRTEGESKLRSGTIVQFFLQWLGVIKYALTHRTTSVWREIKTTLKFCVVGVSGILVNMGILYSLVESTTIPLIIAGIIAVESSILSNFVLNDLWTFSDKRDIRPFYWKILSFHAIASIGMFINILILTILASSFHVNYLLANMIGILVAFIWNFLGNREVTWNA